MCPFEPRDLFLSKTAGEFPSPSILLCNRVVSEAPNITVSLRPALLWASCHLLEVSEMLFSQHCLESVIFAAVLNYFGEGKNSGNGATAALHLPVSLGRRSSVTAALWAVDSFCPQLLLLRGMTLRCCQCCYTFAAVIQCYSLVGCCSVICHPLVLQAWVCATTWLCLPCPPSLAKVKPWHSCGTFIYLLSVKNLQCIAIKQMVW